MASTQDYQTVMKAYTTQLRSLFVASITGEEPSDVTRGSEGVSAVLLAERAEQLIDLSHQLGGLTTDYLESNEQAVREAAELKLLAQSTAEFEVAHQLLEFAEEEEAGNRRAEATRSARSASVQRSLDELARLLETPLEAGITPFLGAPTRKGRAHHAELKQARAALQGEVDKSLKAILKEASKVGGRAIRDLLLMDLAALWQGIELISKDTANLLKQEMARLGEVAQRLVTAAIHLLLQAYDWVRALLGKEAEQQAQKQVHSWLDELKSDPETGEESQSMCEKLLKKVYQPETITADVTNWLQTTQVAVVKLNQTTEAVAELADRYQVKADKVERLLKVIALAKVLLIARLPHGQVIAAAVTLSLLGYVVYTGYDHVDSGRITFMKRFGVPIPDRVMGVRETVRIALSITS